jgi:hypothetical protein
MDINNYFNIGRLFHLGKIELINGWKIFLLANGIVSLVYLTFDLMFFPFKNIPGNFFPILNISLFIGIVFTSSAFNFIHNRERAVQFLLLPASIEEKFLVKFLFSSLVYFICSIVLFLSASLISSVLKFALTGSSPVLSSLSNFNILNYLMPYIFFHSAFFFGSIFFKKNSFIKTLLSFLVFLIFMMITLKITTFIFSLAIPEIFNLFKYFGSGFDKSGTVFGVLSQILLFSLPVVFYSLTYVKLKKIEVK